jgi:hypothetical protein
MDLKIKKEDYKSTLKDTSWDKTGKCYLLSDSEEVYNFDDISKAVAKKLRLGNKTRSCDALYINKKDEIFLIEFKNRLPENKLKTELHEKAHDSFITLLEALYPNELICDIKPKCTLIIVYNEKKNDVCEDDDSEDQSEHYNMAPSIDNMEKTLKAFAKVGTLRQYKLKFKNYFYKDVFTIDKDVFIKEFKPFIFI